MGGGGGGLFAPQYSILQEATIHPANGFKNTKRFMQSRRILFVLLFFSQDLHSGLTMGP